MRFKDGAELTVLRSPQDEESRAKLRQSAGWMAREAPSIAGFAIVAWQPDGRCWTSVRNSRLSSVAHNQIASFIEESVRTHLLRSAVEDDVREMLGLPPRSA